VLNVSNPTFSTFFCLFSLVAHCFFINFAGNYNQKNSTIMEQNEESKRSLIADYYTEHYDELKSFVVSRLHTVADAEDIVQNLFVRLLQSDRMITPVTLPCLVYTMARNLVIDYWRRRQQAERYEHFILKGDWIERSSDIVESVYSAQEVTEILERGIAQLTEKQSCVYRMNLYEDMPVSQIASTLNLSYKSVEKRLGAARKKMRGYVEKSLVG